MAVVDTNTNCANKIDVLKARGVTAVGRYYARSGSKRLTRAEALKVSAANIALFTVFEAGGDPALSAAQGRADAAVAAASAVAVGQPEGSAIYFALEHLPHGYDVEHLPGIRNYVDAVRAELAERWKLGLYSDGIVLATMLDEHRCDYTWLSASSSFPGSKAFYKSNRWSLFQQVPVNLDWDGLSIDTNEAKSDFGAFKVGHSAVIAPGGTSNDDPAAPVGLPEGMTLDAAIALANGTAAELQALAGIAPTGGTIQIDWAAAAAFYTACITSQPRVSYGLGAKIPNDTAKPGVDFARVDCSGFVRSVIRRTTNPKVAFPDGSVVQHDWVKVQDFPVHSVADGKRTDGAVRIAFLSPNDVSSGIGHVALLHNGYTLESHGGTGPDRRPWTGMGWQAKTKVYLLDPSA